MRTRLALGVLASVTAVALCATPSVRAQSIQAHNAGVVSQRNTAPCLSSGLYGSNWLRGAPTSDPTNRRAFATAIGGTGSVYNLANGLEAWTGTWNPPQMLYEHDKCLDDPTGWYETGSAEGSTWSNGTGLYGELVADMQATRSLKRFRFFQMYSDGKTTSVEVFTHGSSSATPPAINDAGWTSRGSVTVGAGTYSAPYIFNPTELLLGSAVSTRYVKIRAMNDGSYLSSGYIELKGVKAFSN